MATATGALIAAVLLALNATASPPSGHPSVSSLTGSSLGSAPPFLYRLGLADDPSDGYVLAFGGETALGTPVNFTLSYRDGTWTNLTPTLSTVPPPRWGASMFSDPVDHEVVLFGGCQSSSCYPSLDDTWTFSGGAWHDITASAGTPPSGRGFASAAWDGAGGFALLFGGEAGTGTTTKFYADSWEFVGNHWTNLTSTLVGSPPPPRDAAAIASLPSGPVVLFGGRDNTTLYNDTWSFIAGNWTNVSGAEGVAPPARSQAAFAPDVPAGDLALYGGYSTTYLNDGWTLGATGWSRLSSAPPHGLYGAGFAFDSEDGYDLLYGGQIKENGQTGVTNGYWSYTAGNWHLFNPYVPPPIDWLAIAFPVVLVVVVVTPIVVISNRRQRQRIASLTALMPDVGADVRWVLTGTSPGLLAWRRRQFLAMAGLSVLVFTFVGISIFADAAAVGPLGTLILGAVLAGTVIALPVVTKRASRRTETISVGVGDRGVVVRQVAREIRIPWQYLQPPAYVPRGPWVVFRYFTPDRAQFGFPFAATQEQARAILEHPRAGGWAVPPPVLAAVGLSPTNAPTSPSGSGAIPSAGPPPVAPSARATNPTASLPSGPLPSTSAAPAQVRRCPRCGGLSSMRARFCSRCGQPLVG